MYRASAYFVCEIIAEGKSVASLEKDDVVHRHAT